MSFERCWNEYVAGFGDVDRNFWLGLDAIHYLTEAQPMSLQIDVEPYHTPAVSISYQQFHVGDAASEYLLTITSDTQGYNTLYTSMNYHSGRRFSTYDNDNDISHGNCAEDFRAGWWFSSCHMLNLNGVYGGASNLTSSNMVMLYLSANVLSQLEL